MKKIVNAIVMSLILAISGQAQNEVDALRYSITEFGGTARYSSMAGAFSSLGGDFSTIAQNPAGIGIYTSPEFSITPSLYIGKTKSDLNGSKMDDSQVNFNLGNVGFVFVQKPKNQSSAVKFYQFGFGLIRTNNFNNRTMVEGRTSSSSIVDTYVHDANGINFEDIEDDPYNDFAFDLNLAWWTYLINTLDGSSDQYYGAVPEGTDILQRYSANTWGSTNEMVLSLGANFNHKFYIGGTLGFPTIRYFKESTYSEIDDKDFINDANNVDNFNSLALFEELQTTGSGFNMKLGVIYRLNNWMRISGAIHSNTWYFNMTDSWYTNLQTDFDNGDSYFEQSPVGTYEYTLETPWKAIGGISFILGKRALISADYEYVDYTSARLRGDDFYNFYNENKTINDKYTSGHNIRLGSEVKFDQIALRAGTAYYSSPFNDDINDGSRLYFTGGVGYREKHMFIDLAYVQKSSKEDYYFYGRPGMNVEPVSNKLLSSSFMLTIGFRY